MGFIRENMKKIFLKDKERVYYILAGIVFLCGIVLLVYFLRGHTVSDQNTVEDAFVSSTQRSEKNSPCPYQKALTGECVPSQNEVVVPLIGVMIENFVDVRPQSGIAHAEVVYEAPAEGNITRFLAIFSNNISEEKVGPVRSARPYYLDWISEYPGAMYMHVGGSPEALEKLEAFKIFDINEFYKGIYFWRDENKSAPHNVFTSSNLWNSAYEKFSSSQSGSIFESWKFSDDVTSCVENCIHQIEIPFLRPSYDVVWKYNPDTLKYDRFHGHTAHLDQDGTPVRASTLVVQHVSDKILDDVGRRALGTIGQGTAEVYRGGNKIEGTWKKETRTSRTRFFDTSGQEIAFAPGHIWIEVVPLTLDIQEQ